jgi:alpha-ribazole phosphatase
MTTIVDLVRHGEPVGGRAYRGNRIDDPLSETGWKQMRALLNDDVSWQRVITSPMCRCREFAEEVATQYNLPLQVAEDLKEVGFGSWEGQSPKQIQSRYPQAYQAFYDDPLANRPEGAEPLEAFFERVTDAYAAVVGQYPGEHLVFVTHAGVIRAIVAGALKAPIASMYQLRIDYASLSRIRYSNRIARLESFNNDRYRNIK